MSSVRCRVILGEVFQRKKCVYEAGKTVSERE